jgi:chromosome segregation protein
VLFDEGAGAVNEPGLTPLRDAIKVLNGFGRTLESILPKLRHSYLSETSRRRAAALLALSHAYFLTPEGECFHNATVTGGKPASEGPLALKRELREAEAGWQGSNKPGAGGDGSRHPGRTIEELTAQLEARSEQRAHGRDRRGQPGRALKQMEGETQRIERRLQDWTMQAARNKDACEAKRHSIARSAKKPRALRPSTRRPRRGWMSCRPACPAAPEARGLQQEAAQVTAELAGLEERRRGAEAAFQRIDRLHADLERRVQSIEQQRTAATAEREQRIAESAELAERQKELAARAPSAGPDADHRRAIAGAAPAVGGDGDAAQDRARRARSVARESRRPFQRTGQAALRS